MERKFDLLGDPIPDNHGGPGANGHIATAENVNKVRILVLSGMDKRAIAEEIGISVPTLTKHYFRSGHKKIAQARKRFLADERAKNLLRLDKAAKAGNVAAIKAFGEVLAQEAMRQRMLETVGDASDEQEPKAMPRGKKEQQIDAASQTLSDNPLLDPTRLN